MADGYWDDIEGILNTQLASVLSSISDPVVYENQGSDEGGVTDSAGTYIEQFFLPADSNPIEIGSSGRNRQVGVYQISINIPQGVGKKDAYTIANLVTAGFKRGTVLTNGTVSVTCEKAVVNPGGRSGMHYRVPVSVEWLATVAN